MDDEQHVFTFSVLTIDLNGKTSSVIQPKSQFELLDELLPSLNSIRTIGDHSDAVVYDVTSLPIQRITQPGSWNCSPYSTFFGSSAGSSSNVVCIYENKHPFISNFIRGPHNYDLFEDYATWLCEGLLVKHVQKTHGEDHYKKNKAALLVPMDLGIYLIIDKNWFYTLSFDGQLLNDVAEYADLENGKCVAKEVNDVREYIIGYRLMAAIPWNTVDHVFIPVNVKERSH